MRRCIIESEVDVKFPKDLDLKRLGAKGYIGEPILDSAGEVLGLIVGMTRVPLSDSDLVHANLRILAARAGAEFEQREAMERLRQERDTIHNILQTVEAIIVALDRDGRITRRLSMAVNVSARQFHQPDFVAQTQASLEGSGASPRRLKLELTESVVLENAEEVVSRMEQLKALGVSFSMDDFGTGYSSLSYLKRLPLDQLKIDKSFVRDIATDPSDAAIVRAILAMSQSLGLEVIAEGVETEEQRMFLRDNGCHVFQGYLLGKPKPIEEWGQCG